MAAQTWCWCACSGPKKRYVQIFMHFNEVQGPQCLEQLGKQGLACVTHGPLRGLQTGVDTEPGASNNTSREAGGGGSYTHLSLCWGLDCRLTERPAVPLLSKRQKPRCSCVHAPVRFAAPGVSKPVGAKQLVQGLLWNCRSGHLDCQARRRSLLGQKNVRVWGWARHQNGRRRDHRGKKQSPLATIALSQAGWLSAPITADCSFPNTSCVRLCCDVSRSLYCGVNGTHWLVLNP